MKRSLVVLAGLSLLVACQAEGTPPPDVETFPFTWRHPFANEVRVVDVAEAAEILRFPPVVAEGLGEPVRIVVNRPDRPAMIAFIYDHPEHGRFHVIEETSSMSQTELESLADRCDPTSGCSADMSKVTFTPGVVGVQIEGIVTNGVMWKVGHILFDVVGSVETFDPDGSLEVARAFVAASSAA